ncbi:MAG: class E sortase, partial [Agrococcus sp.]
MASVLGELLVTAGVLSLGFAGWQVWLSDAVMGSEQQQAAQVFAARLGPLDVAPDAVAALRTDEPPAEAAVADGESFAVMHIPRLGQF